MCIVMKKIFIWFSILLVIGCVVFFFGWMQFAVPAGNYGVMLSKSGGYYQEPIEPGKFTWRWERLIPTNTKLLIFNLSPLQIEYETQGNLPSSEKFTEIMEKKFDFNWKMGATIFASVKPSKLTTIIKNENIKLQNDLDVYIKSKVEESIQKITNEFINYFIQNIQEYKKIEFQNGAFQEKLSTELQQKLGDEIVVHSVTLSPNFVIPDFTLYATIRDLYNAYEKTRSEMLIELTTNEARKNASQKFRMDEMKNWGEFLKQYPQLIEFLAVARDDARETLKALRNLQTKTETTPQN